MSWTESDAAHKLIRRKNKKQRDMARKSARREKSSRDSMNAEHMEMTDEEVKEIITLVVEEDNPPQLHSVYRKYPMEKVAMAMRLVNTRPSLKKWSFGLGKSAEMELTPDIMDYPGLPVVPDSYGTNSALTSGQGVPVWYGSAESSDDIRTASDLVDLADSNNGSLPFSHTMKTMGDNEYLTMIDSDDDEVDFIFLDGTMATCLLDNDTLTTFVVAYEPETFEAMARYDPSEDDIENATLTFAVNFPSFNMEELSRQYLTYQEGSSSKFHMFWLAQDAGGSWYAFNGYARLGYTPRIQRITGPTSQEQASRAMQSKMNAKIRKGYINQSKKFGLRAESFGADMITEGLPVIPDSYGTNSALSSGQGVPVWYGSAEGDEDEDFDHSTYEYKEVELAKPFRTAFMASLGFIVAPLVALSGLAFFLGEE